MIEDMAFITTRERDERLAKAILEYWREWPIRPIDMIVRSVASGMLLFDGKKLFAVDLRFEDCHFEVNEALRPPRDV